MQPGTTKKTGLTASALADMGKCERQLAFEARYGERRTPQQQQRRADGDARHHAFYREAIRAQGVDSGLAKPWCFVASAVYGIDAPETAALRLLRDRCLRRSAAGRAFVRWYYARSPGWCALLAAQPRLRPVAALALRPAVWLARLLARPVHGGRHG